MRAETCNRTNEIRQFQIGCHCFWVVLSLALSSCSQSLLFSPALNAPRAPLLRQESQLFGGTTYLTETLPSKSNTMGRIGGELGARYGFTEKVSAQVKGWLGNENRWGGLASIQLTVGDTSSSTRQAVVGSFGLVARNNTVEGNSLSLGMVQWLGANSEISPYLAIQGVFGWRSFPSNLPTSEVGLGSVANCGATWRVSDDFSVNSEIGLVGFYNVNNKTWSAAVSPSVMVLWSP